MNSFDFDRWDAVVFDVDGTLYEQAPLRRKMVIELLGYCARRPWRVGLLKRLQMFRKEREQISEEEAENPSRAQFERPAAKLGIAPDVLRTEVAEWIERRPLRHLEACRVVGVRRFFARLRARGVRIAVLSDYPAVAKLEALGLAAELVVSGVDPGVDRLKPHPAGLRAVVARLGLPPEGCLMVGDRDDRDGECARRAGVECLLRAADGSASSGRFRTFTELLGGHNT